MKAENWLYFALTEATRRLLGDLDDDDGFEVGTEVWCASSVDSVDSSSADSSPPVGIS